MKFDLAPWRERRWIVAPALVFFLANFAFFLAGRAVDASRRDALEASRRDADRAARDAAEDLERARLEQAHVRKVEQAAKDFYGARIGTVNSTMASTVAEIHQVCRAAHVAPHQISYSIAPLRETPLSEMTIAFAVSGNYQTLRSLLRGFEQDPRWLVVRSVDLSRRGETVSEGEVQLTIATYFTRNTNEPAELVAAREER